MLGLKQLDKSFSEPNLNTIHVGIDISHSSIRYAIGKKSKNEVKPVEILGINEIKYNESSILATIEALKEEALMEFCVGIRVVDLCVSADELNVLIKKCSKEILQKINSGTYKFENMDASEMDALIEDCSESLFQVMSIADIDINRIEIVGNAASQAVVSKAQIEDSCLFLDIRKNGFHIHVYRNGNVYQYFLAHSSNSLKWGGIEITSALNNVKKLVFGHSITEAVITGEVASPEVVSIAEPIFLIPCRLGIPNVYAASEEDCCHTHDLSEMIQSPEYSAVIGLLIKSVKTTVD